MSDKQSLGRYSNPGLPIINQQCYVLARVIRSQQRQELSLRHVAQSSCGSPHNAYWGLAARGTTNRVPFARPHYFTKRRAVPWVSAVNSWGQIRRKKTAYITALRQSLGAETSGLPRGDDRTHVGQVPSSGSGSACAHLMARLAKR